MVAMSSNINVQNHRLDPQKGVSTIHSKAINTNILNPVLTKDASF